MSEQASTALSEPYKLLIDGSEKNAISNETMSVTNPSTGNFLTEVPAGSREDVQQAITSAGEAFETWSHTPPEERGRLLNQLADRIREEQERLARIETLENGKPLSEARDQVRRCARHFEYYGGLADKIQGESIPLTEDYVDYTIREPLGITAHIVPWNVPIYLFARSVAPALVTGNSVVVKPAEETPLGALEVARLAMDILPGGVLNVVTGDGPEAGSALTSNPEVACVTFTGSGSTGREVGKAALENVTDVHLELGGKSPLVIYPDADVNTAVDETITGIFTNAGQVCSASSRVLVHEQIHDEYIQQLVDRTADLTIDTGLDDPDMGPLVSKSHMEKVKRYVDIGREEIGEPIIGGEPIDRDGYFFEPTIFDGVDNSARIAQEEIFGPVLAVTTFTTEEEAIQLANDVDYGLVAGVITSDVGKAHRFARDVDAGQIYVNEWFAGGNETPFGGFKDSGIGRENGIQAVENYSQIKNVCLNIGR